MFEILVNSNSFEPYGYVMIRVPSAFSVSGPGGNLESFRQPLAKIPIEVGDFPIKIYDVHC